MSDHDNVHIVQDYVSTHAPEYVADDVIYHDYSQPEPVQGRQAVNQLLDSFYRTGFTDAKLEVRNIFGDDHHEVLEVIFHGVNAGPWRGHPPTGKRVELAICGVYDIEAGVIRRVRVYYDNGLLERQLGWVASQ